MRSSLAAATAVVVVGLLGCDRHASTASAPAPVVPGQVTFHGMCDASGAVALGPNRFIVADDESNELHVYDVEQGGAPVAVPVAVIDVTRAAGTDEEMDLEAATRLGDRALWISSHGRSKKGKLRPERLRLFATTVDVDSTRVHVVGRPYTHLLDDLIASPALARFDLASAAEKPPKSPGGLSIEGITSRPEGGIFIGFRNPVPDGMALLVPLENPLEVVEGAPARLGAPRLLDLGGLGVRALSWWQRRYLILAGAVDGEAEPRLYQWDGTSSAPELVPVTLGDLNPEGFFAPEEGDQVMLLSDDGSRNIGGKPCKKLREPAQRSFRGQWVTLRDRADAGP